MSLIKLKKEEMESQVSAFLLYFVLSSSKVVIVQASSKTPAASVNWFSKTYFAVCVCYFYSHYFKLEVTTVSKHGQ